MIKKKKIHICDQDVCYDLKKSRRAKRMRLTIYCDGSLNLTMPASFLEIWADNFIREKSDWIMKKLEEFSKYKNLPYVKSSKEDYLLYKDKALELACERVKYFNQFYNVHYNKVSIRNQKSRWGSCSINGNLNFNYKIILLPEEYRDYVIVHEICHLLEFNHSKGFWDLVGKMIPNYREIRRELRRI